MALFKIEKGLSSNLTENRPNTNEGWCYFTTDDGKFYIDTDPKTGDTSGRIALNANKAELLKSPTDGSVAGIDWAGSANNAEYFAVWDSTTHNNPYIRAMNAENMRTNLDVPTRTGGNASGNWGINITGCSTGLLTNGATLGVNKNVTAVVTAAMDNKNNWATERDGTNNQMCEHYYDADGNYNTTLVGLNSGNYSNYAMPTSHWAWAG